MIAYYGYFGRARAERITAISEHLAHLELLAESIANETEQLRQIESDQQQDVKSLAGARDQRARTLAQVQSKIKNRNDELAKLQREAQALEKLVEELRRAIEGISELSEQPFLRVKGKLPWPVKGSLLARFGTLRAGGPLKWQGMVIAAERGHAGALTFSRPRRVCRLVARIGFARRRRSRRRLYEFVWSQRAGVSPRRRSRSAWRCTGRRR